MIELTKEPETANMNQRNEVSRLMIKLDPGAAAVIRALEAAGFKAYVVGGCVRDSLLGKQPHDWDLCSSATPEQVLEVFTPERCIPTGLKHGTITVKQDGGLYEVTTFRTEGTYTDGRHPDDVQYIGDLTGDLARRDFTMNAMAYNEADGLVDPFGGREDLLVRRVVRAVGDPMQRFGEDALRIMRLFRFAARERLDMEQDTLCAALALKENLRRISAERIREEMLGLLKAERPGRWILPEVFGVFLPEIVQQDACKFNHITRLIDAAPAVREVRLAALLHGAGGQARPIMRRLRFDVKTMDAVAELTELAGMTPETQEEALRLQVRRFLNQWGDERAMQLCMLRAAQIAAGEALPSLDGFAQMAKDVRAQGLCCSLKELAVNGGDLICELGMKSGSGLGDLLVQLLDDVVTMRLDNSREALLRAARERLGA